MNQLAGLYLDGNRLSDLSFLIGLTNLIQLSMANNQMTSFNLPVTLPRLSGLILNGNRISNFAFLSMLPSLEGLQILSNSLSSLHLPDGVSNLQSVDIDYNQIVNLTFPPSYTNLNNVSFENDPLKTIVWPEPLSANAPLVQYLQSQGITILPYPLALRLAIEPQTAVGNLLALTGPPGLYAVLQSSDLHSWSEVTVVTNDWGSAQWILAPNSPLDHSFYRARGAEITTTPGTIQPP
jgi:hypothetical protein